MIQHRETLILYTTAVCNLNCVYCFIDKNPALQVIDQYLNDSFIKDPDYYINFAKEMFYKNKLRNMQIWGGEPFLGMHRAYYTIEKCIEYFPNLYSFMASTNMVSEPFSKEFWGLIEVFKKFPDRKIEMKLQLSCDGPEYINDTNRGKGVTEKIIKVFSQLIQDAQEKLPDNVTLSLFMKPTLDSQSIADLQTKQRVLEYFNFFEQFMTTFNQYNKKKNLIFRLPIPNTACPSPHTKQDGINFANYCRITREIENENQESNKSLLEYYDFITSFKPRRKSQNTLLYGENMGHCGNGRGTLGLLPNNMVSCCHNGFVDMISDYKKNTVSNNSSHLDTAVIEKTLFTNQRNQLMFEKDSDEFKKYEMKLEEFYDKNSSLKIANAASLIMLLANVNQVDEKYKNPEEAIQGAKFVFNSTAFCVRDHLGVTGSIYMYPVGLFKLLLNGAREYIEQNMEEKNVRK